MDGVSILFITYNRSELLTEAYQSLVPAARRLRRPVQVIIADDASEPTHQSRLRDLGADIVVTSARNRGLSHNHNAGLDACEQPFILSIQDDWVFTGDTEDLEIAIQFLEANRDVGDLNFLPSDTPFGREERKAKDGQRFVVYENDGQRKRLPSGLRPYTDRPHLKRADFVKDLGRYREDLPMTTAEIDFQARVAQQTRWKIAFWPSEHFVHIGAEQSFNPSHLRQALINRLLKIPGAALAYQILRWIKRQARAGA